MFSSDEMPAKIESITDRSMHPREVPRLLDRFESSHSSLPRSGRFMRLFDPIVCILIGDMNGPRNKLSMCDRITSQLVRHNLLGSPPWLRTSLLVYRPPEVMLLAVDLNEGFIDEECVAVTLMLPLQFTSIQRAEFDTPKPDRFWTDSDSSLSQQIFDVTVAQIESIVQPDGAQEMISDANR